MFLKSIDLNGFKSFPDKYEIIMDDKITGIVGPNGSGKSNIGDAVRWVLGEQSAKSLRGEKMEDIIFNGTQTRKQKAYCEVTLTFNNMEGTAMSDYSEIEVTRKMYRSGESEYYINKTACRLKDVLDLFRDTGIGKEGYSIIGQGKIDELLNEKALSRRKVFEEAAGIMKYRVRKEESERKLTRTDDNLTRVRDIIDELEMQIEPLKGQCEDAKRYFELKEKQKVLEVNTFLNLYERGRERIEKLKKDVRGMQEENEQKTFELEGLSKETEDDDAVIRRFDDEISAVNGEISQNLAETQRIEGEIRLESEKMRHLQEEIRRLSDEIQRGGDARTQMQTALATAKQAGEDLDAKLAQKRADEQALQAELQAFLADNVEAGAVEALQNEFKALNAKQTDLKSALSAWEARLESFAAKKQELGSESDEVHRLSEGNKTEISDLEAQCKTLNDEKNRLFGETNTLIAGIKEKERLSQELTQRKNAAQRKADEIDSRIKMLKDMRDNFEGYYESVKSLLLAAAKDPSMGKRVIGPVASMINVPEKFETAIDSVLGAATQNIIVHDEYDAKALIEYLRQKDLGKATFLPVQALKVRYLSREENAALRQKGVIGVASELIQVDAKAKAAVDFLLARTVIAEDMDSAIALMRQTGYTFRTVTLKGDVLNPGGVISGGSTKKRTFGLISRDRMLTEAENEKQGIVKQAEEMQSSIAKYQSELAAMAAKRQRLIDDIHAKDMQLAGAKEKAAALQKSAEELKARQNAMSINRSQADTEIAALAKSMEKGRAEAAQNQRLLEEKEARIKVLEQQAAKLTADTGAIKDRLSAVRIELASLKAEKEAKAAEQNRLDREILQKEREIAEKHERTAYLKSETETVVLNGDALAKTLEEEKQKHVRLAEKLKGTVTKKEEKQYAMREKTQGKKALQDTLNALLEKRLRMEMQISRLESDIEAAQNRIWDDYQLTYLNAAELREKINTATAQQEIEAIKEEIRGLGNINPNALEDYRRVTERRDFLSSQREDLEKAIEDLNKVIAELMQNMKISFKERFETINSYFKEAFSELFGGGRAELRLQDEDDLMECGIDIIAEPPGKKLQSISLLSGGEKAMTAIALLFAMQRLNPSPVCLLDEIDAALDDANVVRLADYIERYSKQVQFVIITHRKPTMAICETLYGIAMEERGVSKMLSVKMA